MSASGGPPDGTRIVHHGMDKLLIQQNTIPDGQTASPVRERFQRSQPLRRFLFHLICIFRRGGPFIKGHSNITGVIVLLDRGYGMSQSVLAKSAADIFEKLKAILRSLSHRSKSLRCLQVFDEQQWLTVSGYDCRVVRKEKTTRRGGKTKACRIHID